MDRQAQRVIRASAPAGRWRCLRRLQLAVVMLMTAHAAGAPAFDVVIRNGHVIDGTGSPWYAADLGIRNGRVAAIGHLAGATAIRSIDAAGRVVAPGFIDMLGQSELSALVEPRLPSKLFQGITTEITGEGYTIAPISDATIAADRASYAQYGITPDWRTLGQYFARLERQGVAINLASFVGATSVRRVVLGDEDRTPTAAQLSAMRQLVEAAMRDGAVGLSSALQYPPAPYARTAELIELARVAARHGGIYATHMRSEGNAIFDALDETFRIGREAGLPVEIWHLKASGRPNWGRMPAIVARIEAARQSGLDVGADTYAYPAWFNSMSAFVPPWAHAGGVDQLIARLQDPATRARIRTEMQTPSDAWDNEWQAVRGPEDILVSVVQSPELRALQGKRISEIAALWQVPPIDALLDVLVKDHAATYCAVFGMDEADVSLALQQPWVAIDNDSQGTSPDGLLGREHPHPRAYGTFPRILRKYVREERLLSLPEAIRKFTSLPAGRMRLADRGVLKLGMWADVVIFDPERVADRATFDEPNRLSVGMDYVFVNGVAVVAEGAMTGALPGKVLRGAGFRPRLP